MKFIFKPGDKKVYVKKVNESDLATFHGETLHPVYSTFALGRDFEWSSRLFFLEMKEDDEEGVGTFLSITHHHPVKVGEEVVITATVESVLGNELICMIEAICGTRLIATGKTGQKMLKKERLKNLFA
jgi:fluoroacetyl-CoA thioesterase